MSMLDKMKQKMLESSDSYNFYKDNYNAGDKNLEKRLDKLEKEHNEILDSYNNLFNILFIDYDLKPKGVLKNAQDLCQELLNFIVNVCIKHDIEYWLDYGNLLGAVRHGGFIPWDDDMDLGMMRRDYDKFLSIIDDELESHGLNNNIEVRTYKSDRVMFVQIMYRTPEIGGIFAGLDIFPYDYITSYNDDAEELFREEKNKFKRHIKEGGDPKAGLKEYINNFNVSMDPTDYVVAGVESVRSPFSKYAFKILDSKKIFPLSKIRFNGIDYCCPKDVDYYLKEIYGDYHSIHKVIDQHTRLFNLKKQKGVLEQFDIHISKLKEINDTF